MNTPCTPSSSVNLLKFVVIGGTGLIEKPLVEKLRSLAGANPLLGATRYTDWLAKQAAPKAISTSA